MSQYDRNWSKQQVGLYLGLKHVGGKIRQFSGWEHLPEWLMSADALLSFIPRFSKAGSHWRWSVWVGRRSSRCLSDFPWRTPAKPAARLSAPGPPRRITPGTQWNRVMQIIYSSSSTSNHVTGVSQYSPILLHLAYKQLINHQKFKRFTDLVNVSVVIAETYSLVSGIDNPQAHADLSTKTHW